MAYDVLKRVAKRTGCYRTARWVNRHVLDRDNLRMLRDERRFYAQFIRHGDLCFDVGANFGFKTEVFLSLGATVVAFEPQEECLEEMHARMGPNPRLVTRHAAVGSTLGTTTLYINQHRTGSSLLKDWPEVQASERVAKVPMTTLDREIQQYGLPRFCKIDVEGFELEVFKGLSQPIETLCFEFHRHSLAEAFKCLDALAHFGPMELNVTPAEVMRFAREDWWKPDEFKRFFEQEVAQLPGYAWGDIFVRRLSAVG